MFVLICAAGSQSRWQETGGEGLKQFVTARGEPVVRRLYRLASEHPAVDRVVTVVKDPGDPAWDGLSPVQVHAETWMREMGKFLDHAPHWPESGPLCVLYGDAYYTEQTLDLILSHQPDQPTVYGRAQGPGRRLETFGFRFRVEDAGYVRQIAWECAELGLHTKGGPWRWFHRRHHPALRKYDAKRVKKLAHAERGWVELAPDATDDFDRHDDVEKWRAQWRIPA